MDSSRLKTSVPAGDCWKPPAVSVWVPHCPWCQGWFSPHPSAVPHRNSSPRDHLPPTFTGQPQDSSESSRHSPSLPRAPGLVLLSLPFLLSPLRPPEPWPPSFCPQHLESAPSSPRLQLPERPVGVQAYVCVWSRGGGGSHFCREKAVGQVLVWEEWKPLTFGLPGAERMGRQQLFPPLCRAFAFSSPPQTRELLGAAEQGGSHVTDGETEAQREETRSSHREFLEEMGLELRLLSSGQGFPCYCHLPSCAVNLLVEMSGCEVVFEEKRKGWRTAAYIPLQVRILEVLGSLAAEKLV